MSFADRPGLAAGPRQQSSWRNAPPPANTGVNFGRRSGGNLRRRLTEVLATTGKPFSENSIGMAVATRNLMDELRSSGQTTGGPPPFGPRDRSRVLGALDNVVTRLLRAGIEAEAP